MGENRGIKKQSDTGAETLTNSALCYIMKRIEAMKQGVTEDERSGNVGQKITARGIQRGRESGV